MATELAKAYVQIIPSTEGMKGQLTTALTGGEMASVGTASGKVLGSAMSVAMTGVVAGVAGIGAIVKEAIDAGGKIQQSYGGLDTIYGEASDAAKAYAREAAQAGISANDYAEQAVSFGASLKMAFGGDTTKAVEAANTAILDMTDNAAKMGTPLESIQNAYQGFAKQNYTMLDNLKLGYGGTKQEMERLLADAEKLSGVKYDISNLGDVYNAIHVIQEDLGLTGVAADEAATTFTGSMGAMKAAAENFFADLATGGDVTESLQIMIGNAAVFLTDNLFPMIGNVLSALPDAIVIFIQEAAPRIVESGKSIIESLASGMQSNLFSISEEGVDTINELINGILSALPDVISTAGEAIISFTEGIMNNLPSVLDSGLDILMNLIDGIIENLPEIISTAIEVLTNFNKTIYEHLPEIIEKGMEIIAKLVVGLIKAIPDVIKGVIQIIESMKKTFFEVDWLEIGTNIIEGVKNGIKNGAIAVIDAIKDLCRDAFNAAKNFFKISSPSKLMRDQIGKFIPEGVADGIENNIGSVTDAMTKMADETTASINGQVLGEISASGIMTSASATPVNDNQNIVDALTVALQHVGVYIDGQEAGKLLASSVDNQLGRLALRRV